MRATQLHPKIWNAIAGYVDRMRSPREIYFVTVTKVDVIRKIVYADDFGDNGIPLVAHSATFSYYDTQVDGTVLKRQDATLTNPAFETQISAPHVGDLIVVLDPWGAKRFPICIGIIQSKAGFWQEGGF